jgi:hypothetical protein
MGACSFLVNAETRALAMPYPPFIPLLTNYKCRISLARSTGATQFTQIIRYIELLYHAVPLTRSYPSTGQQKKSSPILNAIFQHDGKNLAKIAKPKFTFRIKIRIDYILIFPWSFNCAACASPYNYNHVSKVWNRVSLPRSLNRLN